MGKKNENRDFVCIVCDKYVMSLKNGCYRNHCPFCLSSLHVDDMVPGDRKSRCHGIMKADDLSFNGKKGWQIIHKCLKCGVKKTNKIAELDDQSDDWVKIIQLSNINHLR